MTNTTTRPPFTRSSGNVFEDLQVAEPAEALAKSEVAALIARALRARRLTQTAAAQVLGIDQPKVPPTAVAGSLGASGEELRASSSSRCRRSARQHPQRE